MLNFTFFLEDNLAVRDPTFSGLKTKQNRIPKKPSKTREKTQPNTEISNTNKKYQKSDLLFFVSSLRSLGLGGCVIIITKIPSLGTSYRFENCSRLFIHQSYHKILPPEQLQEASARSRLHFTE